MLCCMCCSVAVLCCMCCIVGEGEFAACARRNAIHRWLYISGFGHSVCRAVYGARYPPVGLVRGYENCTINYSCLGVLRLFLQVPENARTALVLHASGFVSFLLAFCVVCAYFCLAMIFVSFSLALYVLYMP